MVLCQVVIVTALALLPLQSLAGGTEYVDGYGIANSAQVAACLRAVGAQETDELQDHQWEEWVDCMAFSRN